MTKLLAVTTAVLLCVAVAASALASAPPVKRARVGNDYFKPGHLTIRRGTKLLWKWDAGYHSVTVSSGPARFSSGLRGGGSYSHVFAKKGLYHLYCIIHADMTETVLVK
jgi:plastocyanin